MTTRRELLIALGAGALVAPSGSFAQQQTGKVYRIGVLSLSSFDNTTLGAVVTEGLGRRGYVVGRNVLVDERLAEGKVDRLSALAAELVRLKVDIIVAGSTDSIRAARDATSTIPVVMAFSGDDPVRSGFVTSLARPGGNVTGVTAIARDLAPKTIDLLRDAVPGSPASRSSRIRPGWNTRNMCASPKQCGRRVCSCRC